MDLTTIIFGILIASNSFFLIRTIGELDKVKQESNETKSGLLLSNNNHNHLNSRFDLLYDAVKDLTKAIKDLEISFQKKN